MQEVNTNVYVHRTNCYPSYTTMQLQVGDICDLVVDHFFVPFVTHVHFALYFASFVER